MPLLSVSANDIDQAGLSLDSALPVAWLSAELEDTNVTAVEAGHLTARLSRSGDDIVVRGRATAKLAVPCVRCLEPVVTSISAELALLLKPDPSLRAAKIEKSRPADAKGRGKKGKVEKEPEYEFSSEEADADAF